MDAITLKPIGVVKADYDDKMTIPLWGKEITVIEVFPEYTRALLRLEDHSHFWILCWFDQARRNVLSTRPERIDPTLPEYGVFGLRTPARPNPVALSLVRLVRVEENRLYVLGLDALGGTSVLDIKPYYEQDIIFSPAAPYLRPPQLEQRREAMYKEAINHHQEDCLDLQLALRMGLVAEEHFGKLNSRDLLLSVTGSPCLGDVLQGISRARLSNPPRFSFIESKNITRSVWFKDGKTLTLELKQQLDGFELLDNLTDSELFMITFEGD